MGSDRPEILNEKGVPKCYMDLMKKCWDPNPDYRPDAIEVDRSIRSFYRSYAFGNDDDKVKKQFIEAEEYRKASPPSVKSKETIHPQAIYTSRLLNTFTEDLSKNHRSGCLDCEIK